MKKVLDEIELRNIIKDMISEAYYDDHDMRFSRNRKTGMIRHRSGFVKEVNEVERRVIDYLKKYGKKGLLPAVNGSLNRFRLWFLRRIYTYFRDGVYNNVNWDEFNKKVNSLFNELTRNKRGLIYVEREIELDLDYSGNDNFTSVGECWTWKRNNAESYCGPGRFGHGNSHSVILCGYVHPMSVNWLETFYLNTYELFYESEIRMNKNAVVEVAYIYIDGYKYAMNGRWLLNASANRYKG